MVAREKNKVHKMFRATDFGVITILLMGSHFNFVLDSIILLIVYA